MGGCCDKRSNASLTNLASKASGGSGIVSDEVPKLIDYISRYF